MAIHFIDSETNGLLHEWEDKPATRIECACVLTEDMREAGQVEWNVEISKDWRPQPGDLVVFQNGFDFDLPIFKKFWGWEYDIFPDRLNGIPVTFVDTRLFSQLLNPDRALPDGWAQHWVKQKTGRPVPGPHSLATWAYRMGEEKPQLIYGNVGEVPHELNVAQCKADTDMTRKLYYELWREMTNMGLSWDQIFKPLKIEQGVRHIITQGATEGVYFDTELAEQCVPELDALMAELAERVEPHLPPRKKPKSQTKYPPKQKFKKDGSPTARTEDYFGHLLYKTFDAGEWRIKEDRVGGFDIPLKDWPADRALEAEEPMTMANLNDIKQWLMDEHGWKPTMWNTNDKKERTSPKFQMQGKLCPNLEQIAEAAPIVKDICKWLSYRNRRSVISGKSGETGWLNHPRPAIDHRLPADADTMGTGTFRFTHRVVANIPRKDSLYGEKMRALFRAPPGMVMVGWDASGLEDRCKAHYCYPFPGGPAYVEKILDPDFDVHDENAENWGMPRQKTKPGHYALQYNCLPPKLAETLNIDLPLAEQYHADWWSRNEPLAYFTDYIEGVWQDYHKQCLPAIDGRLVPTRKQHALGNTEMQSAGVIAMKWAMVYWWLEIRKRGIPAVQVIHYHDEAVAICPPEYADEVGKLGVWSIKKAGEALNFRVPLLSEYHVGESWLDVH